MKCFMFSIIPNVNAETRHLHTGSELNIFTVCHPSRSVSCRVDRLFKGMTWRRTHAPWFVHGYHIRFEFGYRD